MNASIENWAAQIRAGDVRALSGAITAVENGDADAHLVLRELFPSTGRAWRIGITGAAGTGKSTLVNCLAGYYRGQGKTVGVIAVDPSSPLTGGAILGDRIRMQEHSADGGVFIRSMASRGALGGLAQAAADAALLLDAAGKDVIILETIGVGQDEIEVVRVADCTVVVLVPGAGDEVQTLKAGLLEIADIFVLNKADHNENDEFASQLQHTLSLSPRRESWNSKTIRTVATEGKGIQELVFEIERFREAHADTHHRQAHELAYWKNWLVRLIQQRVAERMSADDSAARSLDKIASAVASRKKDPYAAADEILASLGLMGAAQISRGKT
jgi:LAO/AO transport system kinase